MKKKIIFVLAHLQYSDGVAKVLCDICNALPKDEYDITVKSLYRFDKDFIRNFASIIVDHLKQSELQFSMIHHLFLLILHTLLLLLSLHHHSHL